MKTLALALTLLALPLAAQAPRDFFPWWDMPIARDLNLTDDQTRQIRATVKENRTRLIDLRAALEKAEIELQDQMNDEYFDQRRAGDAIEKLVAARSEFTRVISQMGVQLRGVLTTEQWRELQKRRPRPGEGPQMQRRMGPGMRQPPPAPRQEF